MRSRISSIILCIVMVAAVFTVMMPIGASVPTMVFSNVANVTEADPSDTIVYTLDYENTGPDDAYDVTITDTIPSDTTFVSSIPFPDFVISDTYTWNIGTVASGASGSVTITVTVDTYLPDQTILYNEAILNYKDIIGNSAPPITVYAAVTVTAPIMAFSKSADVPTAHPGETIVYTLDYENTGSGDATDVVIIDTIPADTTFVSSIPLYDSSLGDIYTWNIGVVTGASTGYITITVTVDAGLPYGTVLSNSATLDYNDANGNAYPQLISFADVISTIPVDAQGPYGTPGNPICVGVPITFQAVIIGGDVNDYIFRWDFDNDGSWETPWGPFGQADYTYVFMVPFDGQARVQAWDLVTLYGGNPVFTTDTADVFVYCPVHNLGSNEYFDEIQPAINDIDTLGGHIIEVDAGTYIENLVDYKAVILTGSGKANTFIDGGGTGIVVEITASGAEISGFTITNSGSGPADAGIKLSGVTNCVVDNNELSGNNFNDIIIDSSSSLITISNNDIISSNNIGIAVQQFSHHNTISGNTIENHFYGIRLSPNSNNNEISGNTVGSNTNTGIYLDNSDSNPINGNTISGNTVYGIYLKSGSTLNTITLNPEITGNDYGIYVDSSDSNEISWNYIHTNPLYGVYIKSSTGDINDNTIEYSDIGIKLDTSPGVNVIGNTISFCTTDIDVDPSGAIIEGNIIMNAIYGIKLDNSFAIINNNIIMGCTYGIYIYYSDPIITNNTFEDNDYAIFVAQDSDPTINNNIFVNNTYEIYLMVWQMDIDPDTLNLKSQGRWITCYLEPSDDVDLSTVDISSIRISDIGGLPVMIPAESHPTAIGDEDGDGIPDLMVKFDRSEVEDAAWPGNIEITVEGELSDGTPFEGYCIIRVIEPGK